MKKLLLALTSVICCHCVSEANMAYHVLASSGGWTASTTWNAVPNNPTIASSGYLTLSASADNFTQYFTAPNTTSSVVGCVVYCTTKYGTHNWWLTLLENGSVVDMATMTITNVGVGWNYIPFPTPYKYTSTTSNYYRFDLKLAGADYGYVAPDSGGSLVAFLAVDNRPDLPGYNDNIMLVTNSSIGPKTLTLTGSQQVGISTNTITIPVNQELTDAVIISSQCMLTWDLTNSATLYCRGNINVEAGGGLLIGTTYSAYTSTCTAELIFMPVNSADFGATMQLNGMIFLNGQSYGSQNYYCHITSGIGTTGNPLVLASTEAWQVNDDVLITPTTQYNLFEERYISKVMAPNQYVLCSTQAYGGSDDGYVYKHSTGCYVIDLQKNIVITSSNPASLAFYFYLSNTDNASNFTLNGVKLINCGENISNKTGLYQLCYYNNIGTVNNCYFLGGWEPFYFYTTTVGGTFSGNVMTQVRNTPMQFQGTNGQCTLNDSFFLLSPYEALYAAISNNQTFNRCYFISGNTSGVNFTWYLETNYITSNNCEFQGTGTQVIGFVGGVTSMLFNNCLFGTTEPNAQDLEFYSGYTGATFTGCTFASPSLVNNSAVGMPYGSYLAFNNFGGNSSYNMLYTGQGLNIETGSNCTDTTVRTLGTNNIKLEPMDNLIGENWSFQIVCTSGEAVYCQGYLQKNAAIQFSTVTVSLYLPYQSTPASVYTETTSTGTWELFTVAANWTGGFNSLATVTINAKSTTTGAAVYVADIFNGTNNITNLTSWLNGEPASIQYNQIGDPLSFYAVPSNSNFATGSMGQNFIQTNRTASDNQAIILTH